MSTKYRWHTKN